MADSQGLFAPRRAMALALLLLLLAGAAALAQAQTLGELINQVKKAREAELMGAPAPSVRTPSAGSSGPKFNPAYEALPRVWSVSGLNERFSAVLVHDGKARAVDSDELPLRLGPWQVLSVGHAGVEVRRWPSAAARPDKVLLRAPAPGASADAYLKLLQPHDAPGGAADSLNAVAPPNVPPNSPLNAPASPMSNPSAQAHAARLPVKRNELSLPGAAPAQAPE